VRLVIILPGHWDAGWAIGSYNNPEGGRSLLGEAIYRYMYRKQWYLVDSLARMVKDFSHEHNLFRTCDLFIPIPCSRSFSDYDPISLLVDWISQLCTIPRAVGTLSRHGLISEYSDSGSIDERRGGITVLQQHVVKNKNVILIDGIFCNGVTASLATQALRQAGARRIEVLTFAKIERTGLHSPFIDPDHQRPDTNG